MRKTYINRNGYRCFKGSDRPVHQYVAEKKLGRPLQAGEVIHHKDRNKLNNSPQNLQVFSSQRAHFLIHLKDAKRYGASFSFRGRRKRR